mmetsp:Transcript_88336/g.152969  ORF Transcript_88336/g.152969 Transcript_88336/m.152969 type:complete len:185 (-) Transcript_88336:81-635(-)
MLIPLPPMPQQMGPPTDYARSRKPVLLLILILQTAFVVFTMVVLLDIIGGFIMAIVCGLGWYAYRQDMNITLICYWGMISLFYGVFDLVKLLDFAVNSPLPLFSKHSSFKYNFDHAIMIAGPVNSLLGALLAYYLYQDHSSPEPPDDYRPFRAEGRGGGGGFGSMGASRPQVFSGAGHRLGGNP